MPSIDAENSATTGGSVVNSWNEWDPLEEAIVGILDGAAALPWDAALDAVTAVEHRDRSEEYHRLRGGRKVEPIHMTAAQRELDEFVSILEGEGVTVTRPEPLDHAVPHATPLWGSPGGNDQANPRDVLIVLGDEILEAPMAWRSRYFEYLAYRTLCKDYFRRGAKWRAAPKPAMTDASYDSQWVRGEGYVTTEVEPLFDAADMSRCGRDVFVQRSHVTNDFGIDWLRVHYGDTFRFHKVEFDDYRAIHIDATWVPMRPGLALTNPDRPMTTVPEILRDSDWTFLDAPRSTLPERHPQFASYKWLSMNMLSLTPDKVIVEAHETPTIEMLAAEGIEAIPCPFRNNYRFGGSFHCATVDVRRRGGLDSYF